MNKTRIFYWISGAILLGVVIFAIVSMFGSDKKVKLSDPSLYKDYIAAYSNFVISKNDVITVQLTDEFAYKVKSQKTKILTIEPKVKGELTWKENNIIEFKPEKPLQSGQAYCVKLNLRKLDSSVPKELKEFVFKVQVKHQFIDLNIDKVITTDRDNFTKQNVGGTIKLTDSENLENIKKCISAELNGKKLDIEIESSNNNEFEFLIKDITRTNNSQTLKITCNGKEINSNSKFSREIEIPELGVFKVLDIQVNQYPEQYVNIIFSDPVKEDQLLEGIVDIEDVYNLKYIIVDNNVKIIPSDRLDNDYLLNISGVKNIHDKYLDEPVSKELNFKMRKPELAFDNDGVILPTSSQGQVISFQAVNIKTVHIRVIKIFQNNILQFLQDNSLDESYSLNRVGRVVKTQTLSLEQADIDDIGEWNTYFLNLSDLIEPDPGAIYRIEIGFIKENAIYPCDNSTNKDNKEDDNLNKIDADSEWKWFTDYYYSDYSSDYYYDDEYYYYDDYYYDDYENSYDDPCKSEYYGYRKALKFNILATNIGIVSKIGSDNKVFAFVTNILTAEPITGAEVLAYDYQQQVIAKATTNTNGQAELIISNNLKPYFIVASFNNQKSYLKLEYYNSLSTSEFDVWGDSSQEGTKAFIYGERGVWRPGDSIYLGFILHETYNPIPEGHPIVLEVKNPKGQLVYTGKQNKNKKGFHVFKFKTEPNDPTGYYNAKFIIGGKVFTKSLMVETIRPNRLSVELGLDKNYLKGNSTVNAMVSAKWLHGAPAVDLQTTIVMSLERKYTPFQKYEDYCFENQTANFNFNSQTIASGKTNADGEFKQLLKFNDIKNAPGVLNATLTTKVFEKGGEFSIDESTAVYYPYDAFVGVKVKESDEYSYSLPTGKNLNLDIVLLDLNQKLIAENRDLEISMYKLDYSWWYDFQRDGVDYISANYNNAIFRENQKCKNGKSNFGFIINESGNYVIAVKDLKGKHIAALKIYASSYASESDKGSVEMLKFSASKEKYNVGETVEIEFPAHTGHALVSIENANTVLNSFWVKSDGSKLKVEFEATQEMAPNVYVNIIYLQEHLRTIKNDRPLRMYGIIPIFVENPETHLNPELVMNNELLAESKVKIQVKEKDGKPMSYTLAMVDEGLLNLTKFKTPNPGAYFYSKEALGVRTWDIFNYVIGAFKIDAGKMLSIGGGDDEVAPEDLAQANRFRPMVKYIGPFELKKGETKTHEIQLPQYIGSVRTMVVAAEGNAFGSAEKTTPVKKPLMILGTAPRRLGVNESFKLPVTVFAMKPDVKNVKLTIKTNEMLEVVGSSSATVNFIKEGEKIHNFSLKSNTKTGIAKIEIIATSGSHVSKYNVELDVKHVNTKVAEIIDEMSGQNEVNITFDADGITGSNEAYLEIYNIPPMNLEYRLNFLKTYPHGCLEQIVSAVFPQLYLDAFMELTAEQKAEIQTNINACLNKLNKYQTASGGFAYWAGLNEVSEWATNYAGHFMLEAEKSGYTVNSSVKSNWLKYQKRKASKWVDDGNTSQLTQAYRLYTLALAKQADRSAMNRLKESKIQSATAWRLASAYALIGNTSIAKSMIAKLNTNVNSYYELSGTFGSGIRDKAMILETLIELGEKEKAFMVLKDIAEFMGSNQYASTQTSAYALLASAKYVKKWAVSEIIECNYTFNGTKYSVKTNKPVYKTKLKIFENEKNNFVLNPTENNSYFVRIIKKGIPEIEHETAGSSNINMSIKYTSLTGNPIDITNIPQGTDFVATVTISNVSNLASLDNVALSQVFPSGWEIINSRMFTTQLGDDSYYTYQDIRDDRVLTYFNIYNKYTYTYRVMLTAAYEGKYYLPATVCKTMYDDSNFARTKGQWITVSGF
ncbi:MAG TPA: MG2 domain-containing protein [Bacteroidales bacterium]|nr:MG2 domain-containing protein [Bacteroidales bacterium]